MTPIDIGLSDSKSLSASNSGPVTVNAASGQVNPVVWIVVGVIALFGLVIWFKTKKGGR